MEPSFLLTIASSMLGKLFGEVILDGVKKEEPVQKPKIQIERKVEKREVRIPSFVSIIPEGYFVGVSGSCRSLQEARRSALVDAMKQIVSSAGCRYQYEFLFRTYGSAKRPEKSVEDKFSFYSSGLMLELENHVQKCEFSIDERGRYVAFVLVDYPEQYLREVRRLAKGSRLFVSVQEKKGRKCLVFKEINDVRVTVLSARLKIDQVNSNARAISLFICKVPKRQNKIINLGIEPFSVRNSSKIVSLEDVPGKGLKEFLLGAKAKLELKIDYVDEIGREKQINCQL